MSRRAALLALLAIGGTIAAPLAILSCARHGAAVAAPRAAHHHADPRGAATPGDAPNHTPPEHGNCCCAGPCIPVGPGAPVGHASLAVGPLPLAAPRSFPRLPQLPATVPYDKPFATGPPSPPA
jgi:hypothetical protein